MALTTASSCEVTGDAQFGQEVKYSLGDKQSLFGDTRLLQEQRVQA